MTLTGSTELPRFSWLHSSDRNVPLGLLWASRATYRLLNDEDLYPFLAFPDGFVQLIVTVHTAEDLVPGPGDGRNVYTDTNFDNLLGFYVSHAPSVVTPT